MTNDYNAPDGITMSSIGRFVLGSKPWMALDIDAILGWGFFLFTWFDDLDEGEE